MTSWELIVALCAIVLFVYICARVMSVAYFRSRAEYRKRILKADDQPGKQEKMNGEV